MDEDFQMEGKQCKDQEKIKDMKRIHDKAREVLRHGVGDSVSTVSGRRGKIGRSRKKFPED